VELVADGLGVTTGVGEVGTTVGLGDPVRCGVLVGDTGLVGVADEAGFGVLSGRDVEGAALGEALCEAV